MNMPPHTRDIPPVDLDALARLFRRAARNGVTAGLLRELFTPNELHDLCLRLRLLRMLQHGASQRGIAAALGISLCKVTRGSRILKEPDSVVKTLVKKK